MTDDTRKPTKDPNWITCRCGARWTGASHGHCCGCHLTFSRGAFDMHQTIRAGKVTCHDPAALIDKHGDPKLSAVEKPWGTLWRCAGGEWANKVFGDTQDTPGLDEDRTVEHDEEDYR